MHKLRNRNTFIPDAYKIPGSGDLNRNRTVVKLNIDHACFSKSDNEKWLLKKAKTRWKWEKTLKELKQ